MAASHQVRIALLGFSIIAFSLVSCSKRELELDEADPTMVKAITESLIEVSATSKSEKEVLWEPGDEIAVFSGELSGKFVSTLKKKPSAGAVFKGELGLESWPEELDIWAVYPYSEEAFFDGETITTTLPSAQIAKEGMFGKDMNLAIAHSNTSTLQFYNVGGGIRFSVTEEGIKKVIFEGLNGEIISGKIKIGFDKDGLPEIQEITKGSQFITLLPPEGQETFEKDTWYYIVAIPGSLEKGYKLRFYKDTNYARNIYEKVLTIKRSFYRDLEKVDEGIEYEAQTTHFPETEDEWEESEYRIILVGEQIQTIIDSSFEFDKKQVIEQIENVDGVLCAYYDEDGTVSVLQKDSLWVYFFPKTVREELKGLEIDVDESTNYHVASTHRILHLNSNRTKENINANNKALILAPYFGSASEDIKTSLMNCGFLEENIHIKKDTLASILLFRGSNLQQYKYVFIDTHGGLGYYTDDTETEGVNHQTIFLSGTRFSARRARHFQMTKQLTRDQIAVAHHGEDEYRFCMNTAFISNTDFSSTNPFFYLGACHSAEIENNLNGGSMVGTLLSNNAGAIAGYSNTIAAGVNSRYAKNVLLLMSNGFSFQKASQFWKENDTFEDYCASLRYYLSNPSVWEEDDREELSKLSEKQREGNHIDKGLYRYYPKKPDNEFFLVNPIPQLNDTPAGTMNQSVHFSWECDLKPFDLEFSFKQYKDGQGVPFSKTFNFKIKYEVYVDGARLGESFFGNSADHQAAWTPTSIGDHTWYVIAKIKEGDTVLASYQSNVGSFNVKEEQQSETSDSIDLGLSVNWASSNIGATTPEGIGNYYAWGETAGKTSFSWENYKWLDSSSYTLTKYCGDPEYGYNGYVDSKTKLDSADDVARATLGDGWRMPTRAEFEELFNPKNCTVVWEKLNGVNVAKLTSLKNGKVLYLPAAGIYDEDTLYYSGTYGAYWTSTFSPTDPTNAFFYTFDSSTNSIDTGYRYRGCPVRAIKVK